MKLALPSYPKVKVKVEQPLHLIFSLSIVLPLIIALAINTSAAATSAVSATVTAQSLSVGVTDTDVAYAAMDTSTTKSTISTDLDDSHWAVNIGNVPEDFNIKSMHSTSAGTTWALAGSPGSEIYTHKVCVTPDDSICAISTGWTAMTTNYAQIADSIAIGDTEVFDLQLGTPTVTTDFNEQTVDVTVQAVAD